MFWDRVAWAYDLFAEGINRKADRALCAAVERLIAPSDAVLECACGTGLLTEVMEPRCRSLVATDFSEKMLKRVEKKCGGRGLQAGVHPGYLQTVFLQMPAIRMGTTSCAQAGSPAPWRCSEGETPGWDT